MYDICTIGHVTLDKVVIGQSVKYMPGGTAFYFSEALRLFDVKYAVVTALSTDDKHFVQNICKSNIDAFFLPSVKTTHFENIYKINFENDVQYVHQRATSFDVNNMPTIDSTIFHLGPLLVYDISDELLKKLSENSIISLDVQGYVRFLINNRVNYADWSQKHYILPYVTILKANKQEMDIITGQTDIREGCIYLAGLGVKEVIVTLGDKGSIIYAYNKFYMIPAFKPSLVIDATGCGDTYMAGYLWKRLNSSNIREAGEFGAAMASLKIQLFGPYSGSHINAEHLIEQSKSNVIEYRIPHL